jgi:hypothetical protein
MENTLNVKQGDEDDDIGGPLFMPAFMCYLNPAWLPHHACVDSLF